MLENLPEAAKMVGSGGLFMMAAANGSQSINKTRILEAIVIAAILSAGGYFIALPVLQEKIAAIEGAIVEVKQSVKEIRADQAEIKRDLTRVQIEQAKRR